eukprot:1152098-Rhodomonas_salina.1
MEFEKEIWEAVGNGEGMSEMDHTTFSAYLTKLYTLSEKWCACFTWDVRTLCCHSTQRIEGLHRSVKHWLRKWSLVTSLAEMLECYDTLREDRSLAAAHHQSRLNSLSHRVHSECVTRMEPILTPYAFQLLCLANQESVVYNAEVWRGVERLGCEYFVWRDDCKGPEPADNGSAPGQGITALSATSTTAAIEAQSTAMDSDRAEDDEQIPWEVLFMDAGMH